MPRTGTPRPLRVFILARDSRTLPAKHRRNAVAVSASSNQLRGASAIRNPEVPQRQRRLRHRGDLGRPFMFTASAAGVPHGFQAGISAQIVNVPVGPLGPVAVVVDARPQTTGAIRAEVVSGAQALGCRVGRRGSRERWGSGAPGCMCWARWAAWIHCGTEEGGRSGAVAEQWLNLACPARRFPWSGAPPARKFRLPKSEARPAKIPKPETPSPADSNLTVVLTVTPIEAGRAMRLLRIRK